MFLIYVLSNSDLTNKEQRNRVISGCTFLGFLNQIYHSREGNFSIDMASSYGRFGFMASRHGFRFNVPFAHPDEISFLREKDPKPHFHPLCISFGLPVDPDVPQTKLPEPHFQYCHIITSFIWFLCRV